jgi:hypothetical protein
MNLNCIFLLPPPNDRIVMPRFRFCIALYIIGLSKFKIKETQKRAAPDGEFPFAVATAFAFS